MKRAEADLNVAKSELQKDDEYVLQVVAYLISQATEKVIKQVYTECGKDYAHTHEIASLLYDLPENQNLISDDMLEKLEEAEALLTKWEVLTRYDSPYMAKRRQIVKMYNMSVELYREVSGNLMRLETDGNDESNKSSVRGKNESIKKMDLFRD